jgi:hypothetical protein
LPWTEIDCKSVKRVQRRAVGMISGLHQKDYEEKLKEIGLTLLKEQRPLHQHADGPEAPERREQAGPRGMV